jgi:hypothetical protein
MSANVDSFFPYPGGHRQSDRTDGYQPGGATLQAVITSDSVVAQAHTAMVDAKRRFERHIKAVHQHRDHYTPDGFSAQIAEFASTDAAAAVDMAVSQVRERVEEAAAQVDTLRRDLSPHSDTATELRATRYWDRTRRILDNLGSGKLFGVAQDLISKADRAELSTLLQELPAYLQARGQTNTWIDAAVAKVVPEYGRAREQLTKAEQALQITEFNAKALRHSFTQGRPPNVLANPYNYDPDK